MKPRWQAFWLTIVFMLGMLFQRCQQERSCASYASWVPDARMHAGSRVTCGPQYALSIQTAMDGYNVICQCK